MSDELVLLRNRQIGENGLFAVERLPSLDPFLLGRGANDVLPVLFPIIIEAGVQAYKVRRATVSFNFLRDELYEVLLSIAKISAPRRSANGPALFGVIAEAIP